MKSLFKRLMALGLCLAVVVGLIVVMVPALKADAAMYSSYTTIAKIGTHGGCNAMQGMDVDGTYIYCAKINSDTETTCSIARVHKTTGDTVWLTNSATGTYYFSQLAHANDIAVCTINGVKTLLVATGGAGKGDYSLVRFAFDGTTLKQVGHYNMKYNGAEKYMAGVKVVAVSSTEITVITKQGDYVFTAKIPYSAASGDINMNYLGKLDFTAVNFGGTVKDISNYVQQGFGYKDNKIFVPMTANYQTSTSHISTIVCFDIDGANGTLKPDSGMSVWIADTTYPDLFEIESCGICPTDGKLYFATNCRKTSSDGNHDGVHVLNGFVYSPTMGDSTAGQNYYFHTSSNKLMSVTTANSVYNSALQHLGTVSGNKITGGRWSLDMPIILKHSDPWVLTWESSSWSGNSLLLSTYDTSSYSNNYFLYRRSGSGLIALGYHGNGEYHNYGVLLSNHGIDDTVSHVYSLRNEVKSDGTNMVYLWVDSKKLGAMNNYYIGSTSQNSTNNWVSGKDFSFSYIGTPQHPVSATLKYLKVWSKGNINAFDEPSIFRWETKSNAMTSVTQFGYTTNALTVLGGSCSGSTYSNYYSQLATPVVLMHNRPWVLEWKSPSWSNSAMVFSSGDTAHKLNGSYLFRSVDTVSLGYCDGSLFHNYGVRLTDYGIDASTGHTYRLTNKIADDGSNMVYLSVDGMELGPMNRYYYGNTDQNTTSNWVSGKDFTFPYIGNCRYPLRQEFDYIQVWENGIPSTDPIDRYRWEASGTTFKNITSGGQTANSANRVIGSMSGGVFNEAAYRLNTPIVLRHDQPWTISWQSSGSWAGSAGGGFLFSASLTNGQLNAPYLYRRKDSGMIGIGFYNGSRHEQYGILLSDHGIDGTASHTYTLTNRIHSDGSNMVYLSVDGMELGAMNNYFIGAAAEGTTSNWLCGKDFTFTYLGTPRFPLSNVTLDYLEVNEGCTHSYTTEITTAATCQSTGVMTYTCISCGASYTETIPASGHSYEATVTAPTCTAAGFTTYRCTICGNNYTDSEIPATGHNYVSGTCTVCGSADPDYIPGIVTAKSFTLSFEDEILVNLYFTVEDMDAVKMGILVFNTHPGTASVDAADLVYDGAVYDTVKARYMSTTDGIAAKDMGDTRYYAAYAQNAAGEYVYSGIYDYSPKKYAYNMLGKTTTSDAQKALCVAMLNYGAEAQKYFGYMTDDLMNAALTDEEQAMIVSYDPTLFQGTVAVDPAKVGNLVKTDTGFSKKTATVSFEGALAINYYFTPNCPIDNEISFYYWTSKDYNAVQALTPSNATGKMTMTEGNNGQYWAQVDGIPAKSMDDTYYAAAFYTSDNNLCCTGVIAYSLSKYCMGKAADSTSNMQALCAATAVYGYYAKAYFS